MGASRSAVLIAAAVVWAAGLMPLAASTAPAANAVPAPVKIASAGDSVLYVKVCTTASGDGSWASPFCTLAAAAAAVQPGQTVKVEPGHYEEELKITRSGVPGAPITFLADNHYGAFVYLGYGGQVPNVPLISVSGAHDVVVRGFATFPSGNEGALVSSSSEVTLDQDIVRLSRGQAAVHVTGDSDGITISRATITDLGSSTSSVPPPPSGPGILIDAGATGIVVTGNDVTASHGGISVQGSPRTEVTGNTVISGCSAGITLGYGSTASTVENNVIEPSAGTLKAPTACPATAPRPSAIVIGQGATEQTVTDYNVIDPSAGLPLYSWYGYPYTDLDSFSNATLQGIHDLAADPRLIEGNSGDLGWHQLDTTSPALDSANLDAPGELATDLFGNGRSDDPMVANTGIITGINGGFADRGAVENFGPTTIGGRGLTRNPDGGPLDGVMAESLGQTWVYIGDVGLLDFSFSDGSPDQIARSGSLLHTFARAGHNCSTTRGSFYGFRTGAGDSSTSCMIFGADYTPMTPSRILATKHAVGVTTTTPLKAGGTVTLPIKAVDSVPAAQISALVLNVGATSTTAAGGLSVYAAGAPDPKVTGVNFAAKEIRSNVITVPMTNGIVVHNTSKGTLHVTVDLEGYYSASGSGFKPLAPVRMLDTSTGLGAAKSAVAAKDSLTVDLTAKLPSSATVAVLNVTVTSPTAAGGVTVYPPGQAVPAGWDVFFAAKEKVTSQVLARVDGGKVTFYNNSTGTVQVAADLAGFFGPAASGATQSFVPYGPVRLLDTGATAVKAKGVAAGYERDLPNDCSPTCPLPATIALDVTATSGKAAGVLTAYPNGATRPTTPNVTYAASRTVSDSATVASSTVNGSVHVYNNSTGTVRIFIDELGYYIAAATRG